MIDPDGMLTHAQRLAGAGPGRPPDSDLRRGVSAAYYAVFHEFTAMISNCLLPHLSDDAKGKVRRAFTHGELRGTADMVVERANVLAKNMNAPLPKRLEVWGPLLDISATDAHLVAGLRSFSRLQEQRHSADYDHAAKFDKFALAKQCTAAGAAINDLRATTPQGREALSTMSAVGRKDLRER